MKEGNPRLNKEINSSKFPLEYVKIGVDPNSLGCVLLDLQPSPKFDVVGDDDGYYVAKNKKLFWINGWVMSKNPHCTLRYGLLKDPSKDAGYRRLAEKALKGWSLPALEVDRVTFFEAGMKEESYWCVVAKLRVTEALEEGHLRLGLVPNVMTYPAYNPHVTICYFPKERGEKERDRLIRIMENRLKGEKLKVKSVNWGDRK